MHAARLTKSKRLKRVMSVLKDRNKHSTWNIMITAKVCAVNSVVSELRANGKDIVCRRVGDVWFYRLVG